MYLYPVRTMYWVRGTRDLQLGENSKPTLALKWKPDVVPRVILLVGSWASFNFFRSGYSSNC
jgi:hypothetical protein